MISARIIPGLRTAAAVLSGALVLGACYYPYGYPAYPPYPTVPATYAQREFSVPASGTAAVPTSSATLPPQYEYAVGSPYSSYYPTYPYPYPYPYPAYYGYPYYGYPYYGYGYPAVSFGFGYWGGSGCCWGHGWHGNGYHGGGWHGGGTWQGGGGWHGGGGAHSH
ncbi:hypothetical protein AWB79_01386 [Caballeronia hypogeia]|uniref:Lipoprotein n=1 Tax=Caballeronia hypogeia TaxID=1777140 RepID=A0A157ZUL0_9BURK|nr:hypothetical protein [Caballeronia hypogeia]SAK49180.1 hypothetical protein AWB79_01386 [Caballeronia hypogeia]